MTECSPRYSELEDNHSYGQACAQPQSTPWRRQMFLNMIFTLGRSEFYLYTSKHQPTRDLVVGGVVQTPRAEGMQGSEQALGSGVAQEGSWSRCHSFHSFSHSLIHLTVINGSTYWVPHTRLSRRDRTVNKTQCRPQRHALQSREQILVEFTVDRNGSSAQGREGR